MIKLLFYFAKSLTSPQAGKSLRAAKIQPFDTPHTSVKSELLSYQTLLNILIHDSRLEDKRNIVSSEMVEN